MKNTLQFIDSISNLAFLSEHTGEPYLYDLPLCDGVNHNSVFVLLQKDDVRAFLSASGINAPILDRITEEDLRDEKIHRKLAIMEEQDKFIKEKILCSVITDFCNRILQHAVCPGDFISLRNPYDILHITNQMGESLFSVWEPEFSIDNHKIRIQIVWEKKSC